MKKELKITCVLLFAAILLAAYSVYSMYIAKDTDGPVIKFGQDDLIVTVGVTDEKLLQDVTAKDPQDKDVTDSLVVEGMSVFMDDNTRIVTYAAFDSDNNVSKATRRIHYADYIGPRFSLTEPLSFPVGTTGDFLENMTARDMIDGDVSGSIIMGSDTYMDTSIPGDYIVRFEVSNSAGDVEEIEQTVHIYDTLDYDEPGVALNNYIVYVDYIAGADGAAIPYNEAYPENNGSNMISGEHDLQPLIKGILHGSSFTKLENAAGAEISIDSSGVDWYTPGVYTVVYTVTENMQVGNTLLTVIVRGEGI